MKERLSFLHLIFNTSEYRNVVEASQLEAKDILGFKLAIRNHHLQMISSQLELNMSKIAEPNKVNNFSMKVC